MIFHVELEYGELEAAGGRMLRAIDQIIIDLTYPAARICGFGLSRLRFEAAEAYVDGMCDVLVHLDRDAKEHAGHSVRILTIRSCPRAKADALLSAMERSLGYKTALYATKVNY